MNPETTATPLPHVTYICGSCGVEFEETADECPHCGSHRIYSPRSVVAQKIRQGEEEIVWPA